MTKIWWVEDFLNGGVMDNRYYSTREEADAWRKEKGYGIVKSWKAIDDKSYYEESAGSKIRVFYN